MYTHTYIYIYMCRQIYNMYVPQKRIRVSVSVHQTHTFVHVHTAHTHSTHTHSTTQCTTHTRTQTTKCMLPWCLSPGVLYHVSAQRQGHVFGFITFSWPCAHWHLHLPTLTQYQMARATHSHISILTNQQIHKFASAFGTCPWVDTLGQLLDHYTRKYLKGYATISTYTYIYIHTYTYIYPHI